MDKIELSSIDKYSDMALEMIMTNGPKLILAIIVLLIGLRIIGGISKLLNKAFEKKKVDETLRPFILSMVTILLKVMLFVSVASMIGIETTSFVAIIGAAGLAVGLALQGSLSNFAAGVLIVAFRPFKSGDYVEIGGVAGSVDSIQIFQTVLTTPDNKMIVVPNGSVIGSPITNYSRHATRRIDLMIGVSYGSDLQKTKELLTRICESDDRILKEPGIKVGVHTLADSSVNFVVRPWVKTADYWNVYFDLMQAIKEGLDKEGIEIPFPQMDVHVNKVEA